MLKTKLIILFLIISQIISAQNQQNLPAPINTETVQAVTPYVSYSGKQMVFIKTFEKTQKLAESYTDSNGNWQEAIEIKAINDFIQGKFVIESPTYNQDASKIYFSLKNNTEGANFDIFVSEKNNGEWQIPKKMPAPINSFKNDTDPCISPDGKTLYFVRNYENKELKNFECNQIYSSNFENGKWTKPVLLPEPVNDGCDRYPRIAADGKTLFISSVRNGGKTGADLYYTKTIARGIWLTPIAIDTLNTKNDEYCTSILADGSKFFYQKPEGKRKKKRDRVVVANIPPKFKPENTLTVEGIVTDLHSNKIISAKIHVIDPVSSVIISEFKNDSKTGKYSIILQRNKKYRIDIFEEGYSHSFFLYDTHNLKENKVQKQNVQLYAKINLLLNIYDNEIFEPQTAHLKVTDVATSKTENVQVSEIMQGQYNIVLPLGKVYKIEAQNLHFKPNNFVLNLRDIVIFDEFERDIELEVKKVDFELKLLNSETGAGIETEVEITNLTTKEKIKVKVKTDKEGRIKMKLRDGDKYDISITPKGYAFYNTVVDLEEDKHQFLDVKLDPLSKMTKIKLNDINFESNSADLNESSYIELNRVVKLLQVNTQIKIEISAHTDDVGSEAYNLKLSNKRAESVVTYLKEHKIPVSQVISKGYGESSPAYLPANLDENRSKNRRVELKILEIIE